MLMIQYVGLSRVGSTDWDCWTVDSGTEQPIGRIASTNHGGAGLGKIEIRGTEYGAAAMPWEELYQKMLVHAPGRRWGIWSVPVDLTYRMHRGDELICSASGKNATYTIDDDAGSGLGGSVLRGQRIGSRGSDTDFLHRYLLAHRSYELCAANAGHQLGSIWREYSSSNSWTLDLPATIPEALQIFLFWLIAPVTRQTAT